VERIVAPNHNVLSRDHPSCCGKRKEIKETQQLNATSTKKTVKFDGKKQPKDPGHKRIKVGVAGWGRTEPIGGQLKGENEAWLRWGQESGEKIIGKRLGKKKSKGNPDNWG